MLALGETEVPVDERSRRSYQMHFYEETEPSYHVSRPFHSDKFEPVRIVFRHIPSNLL